MTPEQQAAYIQSQTVCALAEIEGMKAENRRAEMGLVPCVPYGREDFMSVCEKYGIHHNAVYGFYYGR